MAHLDSLVSKLRAQPMDAKELEHQIILFRKVAAARDKFLNVQLQTQIGAVGHAARAHARARARGCICRQASVSVSCSALGPAIPHCLSVRAHLPGFGMFISAKNGMLALGEGCLVIERWKSLGRCSQ